jgi:hypothetical protein
LSSHERPQKAGNEFAAKNIDDRIRRRRTAMSNETVIPPSTETNHEEKTAMPTKTKSPSHHETTTARAKETTSMSTTIQEPAIQATTHPSIAAAPTAAPASPGGAAAKVPSVAPPPTTANIPIPPAGFTPATPGEFRSVVPRKAELAAMPQALIDLSKFTDFDRLFAAIGLTQVDVTQCLLMGSLWSSMRVSTSQWDEFSVLQEGYAWRAIRATLLRLEQAFQLAAQANPTLMTTYPGLSALLGAKKAIAQKGASTRRLNKAAKAKGEPEIHGVVGKQRQRKAEKAALASGASATSGAQVLTVAPAPQAAPPALAVAPSPPGAGPANGAPGGVAH